MLTSRRTASWLLTLLAALLAVSPAAAQNRDRTEREAFFDAIHAPNYLGTDILHTPIKSQMGGTCWDFATISFLESEVLRQNEPLRTSLAEARQQLDISEYYVVYWAWVDKALEYVQRKGQGFHPRRSEVPFGDGGLSHDVLRVIREHGLVPEDAYTVPDTAQALTRDVMAAMAAHDDDWDGEAMVRAVRDALDRHLAPPPETVTFMGRTMTPVEYARDALGINPDDYIEVTSYESIPFYGKGEVDVPDNWWDYPGFYNLPLDAWLRTLNRALDQGYSVAIDTDWGDMGAGWNDAGIAVIHPDMTSPMFINQDTRESDFVEHRTTDDHLVHAVDHRVVDGRDWYLIKNSHGTSTGRRGYVWMRDDWVAMRVLFFTLHKDALGPDLLERFGG
jgi:bleomycin hydrolase